MEEDIGRIIRPYAMTGGRTDTGDQEIRLEAQIRTMIDPAKGVEMYRWEARRIIEQCIQPTALIEVAARLDLTIGVARVVVADLAEDGVVRVTHNRQPASASGTKSYNELLEKVLHGIRSL